MIFEAQIITGNIKKVSFMQTKKLTHEYIRYARSFSGAFEEFVSESYPTCVYSGY